MEGEDDRLVDRKQRIEILIREPVRVLARRLQLHQVDNVDHPHFQIARVFSQQAASVSSVGTSPQQAITTSGSLPWSLLAQSQIPSPASQCLTACYIVNQ